MAQRGPPEVLLRNFWAELFYGFAELESQIGLQWVCRLPPALRLAIKISGTDSWTRSWPPANNIWPFPFPLLAFFLWQISHKIQLRNGKKTPTKVEIHPHTRTPTHSTWNPIFIISMKKKRRTNGCEFNNNIISAQLSQQIKPNRRAVQFKWADLTGSCTTQLFLLAYLGGAADSFWPTTTAHFAGTWAWGRALVLCN